LVFLNGLGKIMPEKIYWVTPGNTPIDLTDGAVYNVRQGLDGRFYSPFFNVLTTSV